jgi:hypothetical protein
MIAFIDFEASSLEESYPIEIGWARLDGVVGAWLIRPHDDWKSMKWAQDSAQVHGIVQELLGDGLPRDEVLARAKAALSDCDCFSDAPEHDWTWMRMLSVDGRVDLKLLELPADALLMAVAEKSGIAGAIAAQIVDRAMAAGGHSAAGDAAGLAAGFEILAKGGEIDTQEVEAVFERWQRLAIAASPWRAV